MILSGLGAGALFAASAGRDEAPAAADPTVVDRYITQLSTTTPPHPANALPDDPPQDPKLAKTAGRLDKVEPMVGAALNVLR